MLVNTTVFFYTTGLPGYAFFFALRMRRVNPDLPIDPAQRVAMIVTKVPSEPWSMVRTNLKLMLKQQPHHDTWLADEDPSEEVVDWCLRHAVKISTRRDDSRYHNKTWPRRARSKEGNLAYFYDHYGYKLYDIVVQLDADHYPEPSYLEEMLRPFNRQRIGYVAAPSICDQNRDRSWSARGRLFAEAFLHGPLQLGYNQGWGPTCIGSHYAVRTEALLAIGGLGPELAEDLSTSMLMLSHGWEGAFADQAICRGLGPETFQDCMTQEYQWSKSITKLWIHHSPAWLSKLSLRQKIRFVYSHLYYPLRGILSICALALSGYALLAGKPWATLSYPLFLVLSCLALGLTVLPVFWLRQQGVLRPPNVPLISWELTLFELTRGVWALFGVSSALFEGMLKRSSGFRITPKSVKKDVVPILFLSPYWFASLLAVALALFIPRAGEAQGYYLLILLTATSFAISALMVIVLDIRKTALPWSRHLIHAAIAIMTAAIVAIGWIGRTHEVMSTLESVDTSETVR